MKLQTDCVYKTLFYSFKLKIMKNINGIKSCMVINLVIFNYFKAIQKYLHSTILLIVYFIDNLIKLNELYNMNHLSSL